jgi:hypothetical protein
LIVPVSNTIPVHNIIQDLAQILRCKNIKFVGISVSDAAVIEIFIVEYNITDCNVLG